MKDYNQEEIEILIKCEKKIINPPKRQFIIEKKHSRNDMDLESIDGEHKFHVFFRIHNEFQENFSIGLAYIPKDGTPRITLLRCNGPHGEHTSDPIVYEPHVSYHIHKATADNINIGARTEREAEITHEYGTFEEAVSVFLNKCNIKGADKYFPYSRQLRLDF